MSFFIKENAPLPANIPALTSLRFYMAVIVVFFHLLGASYEALGIHNFVAKGYLGVDFFFILSGFILSHVYQYSLLHEKISRRDFYIKRLARIYPLHLFMLLFYVVLNLTINFEDREGNNVWNFIANIFLVQAWGFSQEVNFNPPLLVD